MYRRVYYTVLDVPHCQEIVNRLLIQRIGINQMHVIARKHTELADLPKASFMQTHDVRHSLFVGGLIGAALGIVFGLVLHYIIGVTLSSLMVVTAVLGALFGAWAASLVGITTPSTHLKPLKKDIKDGRLVLIVDLPRERLEEIEKLIKHDFPAAKFKGEDPSISSFP